jgi:hypothetical protein
MGMAVEECISLSQAHSTNDWLNGDQSEIFMLQTSLDIPRRPKICVL